MSVTNQSAMISRASSVRNPRYMQSSDHREYAFIGGKLKNGHRLGIFTRLLNGSKAFNSVDRSLRTVQMKGGQRERPPCG